jgi:hypothetical protein
MSPKKRHQQKEYFKMPTMIVKLIVADFESWKLEYDRLETLRREHGWRAHEIYRDSTETNTVFIVNHMPDLALAKAYLGSDAVRSGVQRAGVQGPPEVWCVNEAEIKQY